MPIVFPISVGGGGLSFTDLSGAPVPVMSYSGPGGPGIVDTASNVNIAVLQTFGAEYAVFSFVANNTDAVFGVSLRFGNMDYLYPGIGNLDGNEFIASPLDNAITANFIFMRCSLPLRQWQWEFGGNSGANADGLIELVGYWS